MACGTEFDAFRVATEYLSNDIYQRAKFNSVLMNAIPEGTFPQNVGTTATIFTLERNELTTMNTGGSAITISPDSAAGRVSGACDYSFTDLSIGFTSTTYAPKKLQYRGPIFCKDEQYFTHDPDTFINGYVEDLSYQVMRDYEEFLFYYYARTVPIYVANSTTGNTQGTASTTLTAAAATSELTQAHLDKLVPLFIANRSLPSASDGVGFIEFGPSGPLWTLNIGPEASAKILTNNAELRTDIRYANPTSLLARLGATQAVKNFRHLPVVLPWRFTHDGTKYVRVSPFTSSAATKGTKSTISDTYLNPTTAPYEAALILAPEAFRVEKVDPVSTVGGLTFPATPRMGEWKWVTGPEALQATSGDACYDPLHKKGRHYGEVIAAPRPGANPQAGAIIFYKRCPNTVTVVGCT